MSDLQANSGAPIPRMSGRAARHVKAGAGTRTRAARGETMAPEPEALARRRMARQPLGGHIPILASDTTSAALLDMKPAEFRSLVAAGALPRGREIAPGVVRWDTERLRAIGRADAMDGDYEW